MPSRLAKRRQRTRRKVRKEEKRAADRAAERLNRASRGSVLDEVLAAANEVGMMVADELNKRFSKPSPLDSLLEEQGQPGSVLVKP